MGHLKPGVTAAQAIADMNAVGAYLEKTYPKEFAHQNSSLAHEGLTSFTGPAGAFVGGLMLLSGLILLAACANLGSLFAAHAADRSREVALRLALGSSRNRILRQLLTEAVLISLAGGALGLLGSIVLLRRLSTWQPFAGAPIHLPVSPDARLYVVALALALVSGFLFGIVPVRQVLRTNPYEIVKAGSGGSRLGRRITVREVLLVVQIAICAVLVTSSLVAVRGLMRSLHSNFGFDPQNTMMVSTNLTMAGYSIDRVPAMQKRMIEAMETIPGVEHAGLVNDYPPLVYTAGNKANVFKDETAICGCRMSRPCHSDTTFLLDTSLPPAQPCWRAGASPGTTTRSAPPVAVVNRDFAGKMFGSVSSAIGRYYKLLDGTRVQVVGVVEDGKYSVITEDQQPAMFLPFLQSPLSHGVPRGAFTPRSATTRCGHEEQTTRARFGATGRHQDVEHLAGRGSVSLADGDDVAGGDGHDGRDAVDHRHLRHGGVLGQQAAAGVWHPRGARRATDGSPASGVGTRPQIAGDWFGDGFVPRDSRHPGAGLHRVSGHSPRPDRISWCCVRHGAVGAAGHMDSSAARIVGGSHDAAARRVTCRG